MPVASRTDRVQLALDAVRRTLADDSGKFSPKRIDGCLEWLTTRPSQPFLQSQLCQDLAQLPAPQWTSAFCLHLFTIVDSLQLHDPKVFRQQLLDTFLKEHPAACEHLAADPRALLRRFTGVAEATTRCKPGYKKLRLGTPWYLDAQRRPGKGFGGRSAFKRRPAVATTTPRSRSAPAPASRDPHVAPPAAIPETAGHEPRLTEPPTASHLGPCPQAAHHCVPRTSSPHAPDPATAGRRAADSSDDAAAPSRSRPPRGRRHMPRSSSPQAPDSATAGRRAADSSDDAAAPSRSRPPLLQQPSRPTLFQQHTPQQQSLPLSPLTRSQQATPLQQSLPLSPLASSQQPTPQQQPQQPSRPTLPQQHTPQQQLRQPSPAALALQHTPQQQPQHQPSRLASSEQHTPAPAPASASQQPPASASDLVGNIGAWLPAALKQVPLSATKQGKQRIMGEALLGHRLFQVPAIRCQIEGTISVVAAVMRGWLEPVVADYMAPNGKWYLLQRDEAARKRMLSVSLSNSPAEHAFGMFDAEIRHTPCALPAHLSSAVMWKVNRSFSCVTSRPEAEQLQMSRAAIQASKLVHSTHRQRAEEDEELVDAAALARQQEAQQYTDKARSKWRTEVVELARRVAGAGLPAESELQGASLQAVLKDATQLRAFCTAFLQSVREYMECTQHETERHSTAVLACEVVRQWLSLGHNVRGMYTQHSRLLHPAKTAALKALKELTAKQKTSKLVIDRLHTFVHGRAQHLKLCLEDPPLVDICQLVQQRAEAEALSPDEMRRVTSKLVMEAEAARQAASATRSASAAAAAALDVPSSGATPSPQPAGSAACLDGAPLRTPPPLLQGAAALPEIESSVLQFVRRAVPQAPSAEPCPPQPGTPVDTLVPMGPPGLPVWTDPGFLSSIESMVAQWHGPRVWPVHAPALPLVPLTPLGLPGVHVPLTGCVQSPLPLPPQTPCGAILPAGPRPAQPRVPLSPVRQLCSPLPRPGKARVPLSPLPRQQTQRATKRPRPEQAKAQPAGRVAAGSQTAAATRRSERRKVLRRMSSDDQLPHA